MDEMRALRNDLQRLELDLVDNTLATIDMITLVFRVLDRIGAIDRRKIARLISADLNGVGTEASDPLRDQILYRIASILQENDPEFQAWLENPDIPDSDNDGGAKPQNDG